MTCEEKIRSEDYREFMMDYSIADMETAGSGGDYCIVPVDGGIRIRYEKESPDTLLDIRRHPYYTIPKCYGLMQQENLGNQPFDSLSLSDAGILQAQGAPLSLTGRGVLIGFVDTGIRYTQEVFRDGAGGSRILAIWDQTIYDGTPPDGFLYGTEYSREQINEALVSDEPRLVVPSWDTDGHGSAVASVAAGSSLSGGHIFTGAAPDAEIVVVKLREAKGYLRDYYILPENVPAYAETDILMAVKYLESFAADLARPIVICIGLGSGYGGHTGSSVLDHYLDAVAQKRSRAIVVCGGNEGAAGGHYRGTPGASTQEAELRVGGNEKGFLMELWSEGPSRISMSLRTPGGESVTDITAGSANAEEYRFILDKTIVTVSGILPEESSGRSLMLLRFSSPTAGVWTLTISPGSAIGNSSYNIWLPIEQFLHSDTYFLRPDPDMTLTAPSMAQGVITVNAYNDANGGFYESSGRGFTADGRIKPDFAAPGVEISTSLGKRTGGSLAAAVAAGAAAQIMQWGIVEKNYLLLSGREIKYYLAMGAERDGAVQYPSREWGVGKINVQRTFQTLAGLV